MQTQITVRHTEATARQRTHVEEALAKLKRFYDRIDAANVVLSEDGLDKTCEVTLATPGPDLRAKERASTLEVAVDQCVEALRRQLLKRKAQVRTNYDTQRVIWR